MEALLSLLTIFCISPQATLAWHEQNPLGFALQESALVKKCGPPAANIVCVDHYAAVLPGQFHRARPKKSYSPMEDPGFVETDIPDDSSLKRASNADFIVFERQRGLELLGDEPTNEIMFSLAPKFHDAVVYEPVTKEVYFSQLTPNSTSQLVISLGGSKPVMGDKVTNPPLYAPTGGIFRDGLIYFCVGGNNRTMPGPGHTVARAGLYTLNATSGESKVLLNNYYGYFFSTCNDLAMDGTGNIWFTDDDYSWGDGVTDDAPTLPPATYRFRPRTGEVKIVEDTLKQPNGIKFSPDGRTLYICDSGAITVPAQQKFHGPIYNNYNVTQPHTVYAFDVRGNELINKRPIYLTQKWVPDGLRVAKNGYLLVGVGDGIDVLDNEGTLLVKLMTEFSAVSSAFAGENGTDLWIVGVGGVGRVQFNLSGPVD